MTAAYLIRSCESGHTEKIVVRVLEDDDRNDWIRVWIVFALRDVFFEEGQDVRLNAAAPRFFAVHSLTYKSAEDRELPDDFMCIPGIAVGSAAPGSARLLKPQLSWRRTVALGQALSTSSFGMCPLLMGSMWEGRGRYWSETSPSLAVEDRFSRYDYLFRDWYCARVSASMRVAGLGVG